MKHQTRSIFHFVLLFVFIFSQVTAQPVSAATASHSAVEPVLQGQQSVQPQLSEAKSGPAPAEKGSVIVPVESFKSRKSTVDIAAALSLLGYALPSYPVYSQQNNLSIEPLVAYNLIVDSNVLSPSSYGPSAGTFGAKYCNTGSSNLTDVWAYIGNYDTNYDGTTGDATAGSFPGRSEAAGSYDPAAFAAAYGASTTNPLVGTTLTDYGATNAPFALQLASGSTSTAVDGSRYIGTLAPGECKTQYWLVTYPRKACSSGTVCDTANSTKKDVTGGVKPEDDLWLPYFFWGTSTSGATTATSYRWNAVTMRNEISAMANKIWPNGDNKVPDQYLQAIQQLLGWDTITPTGTSNVYPGETVVSQGIWYDLGNVGAGFDNNGDFVPDRNAWLQPIGDASGYDPGCFRLVRTYGLVIVKLNDGTEQLIPFVDQMYFENISDNNTGAVGLVFYEYAALDGVCTANLTPYQEVASGYDNEKFNADFGAGIPPLQTQESNMTLEKTGEGSIARTGTITYSLTFTLPDANPDPANTATFTVGQPSYGMPLTYSDAVPVGLQYVSNSAGTTVDMSSNYTDGDIPATLWYSTNGGATWTMGDPGNVTSTVANPLVLQWRLQDGVTSPASGASYTGTVSFQAVVPSGYTPVEVENEACLQIGSGPGFVCDDHITLIEGTNWLGGLTWQDDGAGGGVLANALRDGSEEVIERVTVNLYYDSNSDGVGDTAFGSLETLPYPVIDGYIDFDRDGLINEAGDTGTVAGVSVVNGRLDLNGVDGVTAADDGTFLGYIVIDGYIDIDRDDTVSGDTDDDLAQGSYRFGALPDGSYVVTVDQSDSDIPIGYTPTNRTTRTATLNSTTPSVTGLDFGFGPVLALDKYITPTTYAEGDTMTYTIKVTNMLPGSSSGASSCSYYVWTNTVYPTTWTGAPDGGGPDNSQWQDTAYAIGGPDERFSYSVMNDNTDTLGLSGYNIGDMGGTITSIQYVINVHERVNLSASDRFIVNVYYNDTQEESVEYFGNGAWEVDGAAQMPATSYFTGGTGTEYIIVRTLDPGKITNRVAPNNIWRWSDFLNNLMELQVEANKGSSSGDINLDAAGFIITTNQSCGGSSSTLNPVPLTDAFDNTYLRYLSASPAISSQSTSGSTTTLSWSNVGPLDPGESKLITVDFEALLAVNPTTNTATSANAKFADGRSANTPVTDTANVTITSIGYIGGKVWHNADDDGWVGTNGYEDGEAGIGGVNVHLYACQTAPGVNFTHPVASNDRGDPCSAVGGTWNLLETITTGASGDYLFDDLVSGFYYVSVDPATLPANAVTDGERDTATGDQDGTPQSNTGDGNWGLATNNLTTSTGALDLFNYLESGEHITNVNFAYNGFTPAIYGYVWDDYDGDAVRDNPDDTGMGSVTVTLVNCGADTDCSTGADNTTVGTQVTDSTGFYMFENLSIGRRYQATVSTGTLPAGTWINTDEDAPSGSSGLAAQGTTGDSVLVTAVMAAGNLLGGFDFGYHQQGTFVIGDTLWYDWNGDADWDTASEETISNVTVRLYRDYDNDGVIDSTDPLIGMTKTMAYNVVDGYMDIDRDGTTAGDTGDSGTLTKAVIIDGYVDFDRDGVTAGDTGDTGTIEGISIINGRIDINSSSVVTTTDDGSIFSYVVIDGYVDMDGDGITSGDADDDGNVDLTFIDGRLDVNRNGTIGSEDDGIGLGLHVIDGYFDLDADGVVSGDADDDLGVGQYRFAGFYVANYIVQVDRTDPHFPSGLTPTYDPDEGVQGTSCTVCDSLSTVTVGPTDLSQDFGYQPVGSGRIGDTVFKDINGNGIQDGTGETGISGVTVQLLADWNGDGNYIEVDTATTDSNGTYLFASLPAGTYRVSVNLSSNAGVIPDDNFGNNYFPSNGTDTGTVVYMDKTLATATSSDLTADFGFAPPASIGDTVYQDVNRNGTQDLNEPGINGVTVTLYTFTNAGDRDGVYDPGEGFTDLDNDGVRDSNEPFIDVPNGRYDPGETLTSTGQTTTTATVGDKQGIYQFDGLEPGYYVVQPTPPAGSVLTADPNLDGISCDGLTPGGNPSSTLCDSRDGMRLYNNTNYTGADFGYSLPGTFGDRVWIDSDNDGRVDIGERGIPNITVTATTTVPTGATVIVNGTTYTEGQAISLTATTDADGYYFFQNISPSVTITWTVSVGAVPSGLANVVDPDDPDGDDSPASDGSTTVVMNASGVVTSVGALADADDDGDASDPLYLDADFGYNYSGNGALSGTICLEAADNGICGTGTGTSNVANGIDTSNETAYSTVTVYLYRWTDADSDGNIDAGETTQIAVTQTEPDGDYSFTNLPDGVYYIVAIGAPQTGLALNTDAADLPYVGDDAQEEIVATTNLDGTVLSVYQVVEVSPSETVVNVDFAFSLDGSYDFGDLPQGLISGVTYNYSTLLESAPSGPRHLIPNPVSPTLYLGTGVDVDTNGFPTSNSASADTEENGVTIGTDNNWGDGTGQLNFDVTGSGWLVGWIDFNADGDFSDARELVIDQAVSDDITNYNVTTPFNGTTILPPSSGYLYARFRLFPSEPAVSALAYVGEASNGEVEDYRFPISPTGLTNPVTVAYFYARRQGSTVRFEWSTATETGNVGFNLYAEGKTGMVQINNRLIPSRVVDSHEKQDYIFNIDVGGSVFYIEDVSVLGETRLHGPFEIGQKYGGLQKTDKIDQTAILREHIKKTADHQTRLIKDMRVPATAMQNPAWFSWFSKLQLTTTFNLEVRKTGIYRVSYEMLKDAGLDLKNVPASKIAVTNRGKQIPVYVKSETIFGPGSFLEFYGEALDTIYTDTNIYTVQVSSTRASRIKASNAKPVNKVFPQPYYTETLTVNNQRAFANYAPKEDAWYDTSMLAYKTPKTWEFPFEIRDLDSASGNATMTLILWGATDWKDADPDHHVTVSINNTPVADRVFNGLVEQTIDIQIPVGTLREGKNTLQLTLPGDTGVQWDMVSLDKFSVNYPRLYKAQDGRLTFTAAGRNFAVTNLPNKNVVVYRLDEKGKLERLQKMLIQSSGSTFTATFAGTKNKASTYFVTTVDAIYIPEVEATRVDANLKQPARYLIISHPNFIEGLKPLVQARQAQGFTVSVVDVTDLYAQYSYGIFNPQAIRDYIAYAAQNLGTEYVLLVGGDTYDYRNYLGINSISFIPSLYTSTSRIVKLVPADPLYADIDEDNVPDLAIGRFPVRTTAELDMLVKKTLAYQTKNYGSTATFVSDKLDAGVSFKNISNSIASGMPAGWTVENIHIDDIGTSTARTQLLAAMDRGTALITFTGHSGPQKWTFSGLFGYKDPANLTNTGKPFVVVQWGCWNTYHVDPVYKYMVQSFLFPGDKGAAAVLGSSTLVDSESEEKLGILLQPRLTTPGMPIGKALLDAKTELAKTDPDLLDVLLGWTLMGDPALVIQP